MADEANTKNTDEQPGKKGGKLKPLLIVVGVMVIEAIAFIGLMMLSGEPQTVAAADVQTDEQAELNKLVEVLIVEGKFDNHRSGRTYMFDTQVFVTVKSRHAEKFGVDLEAAKTQVSVDIATIFRRAEPAHFQEPTLATLTRQIKAKLDERFGKDAEDQPIVESVLIAKCLKYRAD